MRRHRPGDRMKTAELYDEQASRAFYEARYNQGYMDDWPKDKVDKILEVLAAADLPAHGTAIDFGCGTGFFSRVLSEALPDWRIVGVDISPAALRKARERQPASIEFMEIDDPALADLRADFLFSHHVIEHVPDLADTCARIVRLLASEARMLHILPCGNPGSLAHTLCRHRQNGIDPRLGNRYFFEDEGHVRRLKTAELAAAFAPHGFSVVQEFYTGQYWGMVDYFTRIEPDLIPAITDPREATGLSGALRLRALGLLLRSVHRARRLNAVVRDKRTSKRRSAKANLLLVLGAPVFAVAESVQAGVERRAGREWTRRKQDARGDQMFVLFRRPRG